MTRFTKILCKTSLDPFINVIPINTSSVADIMLKVPGYIVSIHIAIFLPTAGHEVQFVSALSNLDICIDDFLEKYPETPAFNCGDANVNPKNTSRSCSFKHFLEKYKFLMTQFYHPTYHHFVGNGELDSQTDVLLHSSRHAVSENLAILFASTRTP